MNTKIDRDRWFTPGHIIDGVRELLIDIDLDPASEPEANKVVKAKNYFTFEDNGLTKDWYGKVFVNPPYTNKQMGIWLSKIELEWKINRSKIDSIVALVNRSDGEWYYDFLDKTNASAYYQLRKRVRFTNPDNPNDSPRYSNDLLYWGTNALQFTYICEKHWGKPCPGSYYNFSLGGYREQWRS
jgi:hypothetical protein